MRPSLPLRVISLSLLLFLLVPARADVRSITVGIDVNSPYGLGEPWVIIREGLLRLENIEWVSPQPDRQNSTGELRTKGGVMPDLDALAKSIRDIGAGASLRGVEATIDGVLEKSAGQFVLRAGKTRQVLTLEPATLRIQLAPRQKSPEPLTDAEQKAFQTLTAKWQGQPLAVRITGPIFTRDGKTSLAVRLLDFQTDTARKTTN